MLYYGKCYGVFCLLAITHEAEWKERKHTDYGILHNLLGPVLPKLASAESTEGIYFNINNIKDTTMFEYNLNSYQAGLGELQPVNTDDDTV